MKITNVKVITDKNQSCVIRENVTPAEVIVLTANFARIVGNTPVKPVVLTKREKLPNAPANLEDQYYWKESETWETQDVERSDDDEFARLSSRYRADHLAALFPDQLNLRFPTDFPVAVQKGLQVKQMGETMFEKQIAATNFP